LFCWYWWIVDHHCLNLLLFCWLVYDTQFSFVYLERSIF
jgi:hypothetical protein